MSVGRKVQRLVISLQLAADAAAPCPPMPCLGGARTLLAHCRAMPREVIRRRPEVRFQAKRKTFARCEPTWLRPQPDAPRSAIYYLLYGPIFDILLLHGPGSR